MDGTNYVSKIDESSMEVVRPCCSGGGEMLPTGEKACTIIVDVTVGRMWRVSRDRVERNDSDNMFCSLISVRFDTYDRSCGSYYNFTGRQPLETSLQECFLRLLHHELHS